MGSDNSHSSSDRSDGSCYKPPEKEKEKDKDIFKGSPPPEKEKQTIKTNCESWIKMNKK